MPSSVSLAEAAALPVVAQTSLEALIDQCPVREGSTVLVTGGGSSCGHHALAIAKALGAKVIATCGKNSEDFCKVSNQCDI